VHYHGSDILKYQVSLLPSKQVGLSNGL